MEPSHKPSVERAIEKKKKYDQDIPKKIKLMADNRECIFNKEKKTETQ